MVSWFAGPYLLIGFGGGLGRRTDMSSLLILPSSGRGLHNQLIPCNLWIALFGVPERFGVGHPGSIFVIPGLSVAPLVFSLLLNDRMTGGSADPYPH